MFFNRTTSFFILHSSLLLAGMLLRASFLLRPVR